jgi:hypothetical protein
VSKLGSAATTKLAIALMERRDESNLHMVDALLAVVMAPRRGAAVDAALAELAARLEAAR